MAPVINSSGAGAIPGATSAGAEPGPEAAGTSGWSGICGANTCGCPAADGGGGTNVIFKSLLNTRQNCRLPNDSLHDFLDISQNGLTAIAQQKAVA